MPGKLPLFPPRQRVPPAAGNAVMQASLLLPAALQPPQPPPAALLAAMAAVAPAAPPPTVLSRYLVLHVSVCYVHPTLIGALRWELQRLLTEEAEYLVMGRNTADSTMFQVSCFMAYPAPVQVDGIASSIQHVYIPSCFPERDVGGRALLVTYTTYDNIPQVPRSGPREHKLSGAASFRSSSFVPGLQHSFSQFPKFSLDRALQRPRRLSRTLCRLALSCFASYC